MSVCLDRVSRIGVFLVPDSYGSARSAHKPTSFEVYSPEKRIYKRDMIATN